MQKRKKNRKLWVAGICLGGAAVIAGVLLLLRSPDGQEEPELPVSAAGASEMQDTTEQAESEPGEEFAEGQFTEDMQETEQPEAEPDDQEAEVLTLERLKELVAEPVPLLEHYSGYQGFEKQYGNSYRCPLQTTENGCNYQLDIRVHAINNRIVDLALTRRNDALGALLYYKDALNYGEDPSDGWKEDVISKIDELEDTGELFQWVRMYSFPDGHMAGINYDYEYHNIYCSMRPEEFRTDLGDGTWKGMTYKWRYEDSEYAQGSSLCGTPEWGYTACFMQIPTDCLVFEDGILKEAQLGYEHAELLTEWENVEGCKEQAILCKMNVEQYSPAEIEEAAEAGRPIPGKYQTADMWYLCIGRENSPWAYVFAMKEEYCAREEAMMFSWWIEFRDDAWQ